MLQRYEDTGDVKMQKHWLIDGTFLPLVGINEPPHVHVQKADAEGKIWLEPLFERVYMHGFTKQEEKKLLEIADRHKEEFKKVWHEYFEQ